MTKTDTRERLIDVARELFLKQGYAATGIAQILREAGVNSGSLYYFFPTKEDLLLAVLQSYKQLLWPLVIQPVFDRISDPIERVFGILDGYRQMLMCTECDQGCPIGNLAIELSESHPNARRLIAENFTGWSKAIETCLAEAQERLGAGVNPESLAVFVLTTMEGAVMLARAYRSLRPYDAAITQLRDYFDRIIAEGTSWPVPKRGTRSRRERG